MHSWYQAQPASLLATAERQSRDAEKNNYRNGSRRTIPALIKKAIMSNENFINRLNEYTRTVYDHEQDFIYEFVREFAGGEIKAFYLGRDQCLLQVIDNKCGASLMTTIDTVKFMYWVNGLAK